MKYALMLILTISLSGPTYAYMTAVARSAAPSSDEPSTGSMREPEKTYDRTYHDYDNSDTIQTGQSATKRDYQYDSNVKSCRTMNGVWLRTGEKGYAACMESKNTLKK